MRTIWFLPMEAYEGRYTADWIRWWSQALSEMEHEGLRTVWIEGTQISGTIRTGSKLDSIGTCYWKSTQMSHLIAEIDAGHVQDGDLIFLADIWYPGIEMLDYIRKIAKRRYTIAGILHGGSYHHGDYTHEFHIQYWARHSETAWLEIMDAIFVATPYHKNVLLHSHPFVESRLFVEGLPFWPEEIWQGEPQSRENIIIFPHDKDLTKGYQHFLRLRDRLHQVLPDWQWIASRDITNTREEYYALLRKSKIALSFAMHETFGYSMLEAAAAGCHILVPNDLSYVDIFPGNALWNSEDDLVEKMLTATSGRLIDQRAVATRYRSSANRILTCALSRAELIS